MAGGLTCIIAQVQMKYISIRYFSAKIHKTAHIGAGGLTFLKPILKNHPKKDCTLQKLLV